MYFHFFISFIFSADAYEKTHLQTCILVCCTKNICFSPAHRVTLRFEMIRSSPSASPQIHTLRGSHEKHQSCETRQPERRAGCHWHMNDIPDAFTVQRRSPHGRRRGRLLRAADGNECGPHQTLPYGITLPWRGGGGCMIWNQISTINGQLHGNK